MSDAYALFLHAQLESLKLFLQRSSIFLKSLLTNTSWNNETRKHSQETLCRKIPLSVCILTSTSQALPKKIVSSHQ